MPLHIIRQDITRMRVDAIVNTTNAHMIGYSGVDAMVHREAGPELDAFCRTLPPLEMGLAVVTPGFRLPCRYIIHTAGPVWQGGGFGERALLKSCYLESLKAARRRGCHSVAFPLISSGNYGYPKDQVLKQAVQVIAEYLQDYEMDVTLCVWDRKSYEFSRQLHTDLSRFIDGQLLSPRAPEGPERQGRSRGLWNGMLRRQENQRAEESCEASMQAPVAEKYNPICYQAPEKEMPDSFAAVSLEDHLRSMDAGFADTLFHLIDEKGMTDVECYKKANVDKRTFSKIKSNPAYHPSKQTAVAFAIALQLDLKETNHLLQTAGIALSHSNKFDLIIEYFIMKQNYDIYEINEALFEFDQVLLGC